MWFCIKNDLVDNQLIFLDYIKLGCKSIEQLLEQDLNPRPPD